MHGRRHHYPEDGGIKLFRKAGIHLPDHTASPPQKTVILAAVEWAIAHIYNPGHNVSLSPFKVNTAIPECNYVAIVYAQFNG